MRIFIFVLGFSLCLLCLSACRLDVKGKNPPDDAGQDQEAWEVFDLDIIPEQMDGEDFEWDIIECYSDEDCDDLEPCNGQERCEGGGCLPGEPLADGVLCTTPSGLNGRCGEGMCIPLTCGNFTIDPGEECDDGNDMDEDGCKRNCSFSCHAGEECNDMNQCTDDSCAPGGNGQICRNDPNTDPCNDRDDCTHSDRCDGTGRCRGISYSCERGPCEDASLCDGAGGCNITPATEGTACDDGIDCTVDETCDGIGNCIGRNDNERCLEGELCRPTCFDNSRGCGFPPGKLELSCESPVDIATASPCRIDLDGLSGQDQCLHCTAKVGLAIVDFSDFSDSSGNCADDGWILVTGSNCKADYDGSCNPVGGDVDCCSDFPTICGDLGRGNVIKTDKETNCGGGQEEWRITKEVNTQGLTEVELCLDIGQAGDVNHDEYFMVIVSDASHSRTVLCYDGDGLNSDLLFNEYIENNLYEKCIDLDTWADNNPGLSIEIIANSNNNGDIIYIDNIAVRGRSGGCTPTFPSPVFSETFTGCSDPIPDGWNGWSITGEPKCPGFDCPGSEGDSQGAEADGVTWTMEHDVDTSALDGDVHLCFELGEDGADPGESINVEFSTQGGGNWQTVWYQEENMTPDQQCKRICRNLSLIDEKVRGNPNLRIRFTLVSGNRKIDIDDIEVSGAVYCDAAGMVQFNPLTESSPGNYEFSVSNLTTDQISAVVSCWWDTPAEPVGDSSEILFRP